MNRGVAVAGTQSSYIVRQEDCGSCSSFRSRFTKREHCLSHEWLAEHGIAASTGIVDDSYDNALAENVHGSYESELIHTRSWSDVVEMGIATFEWMNWWSESRLHQPLGYRTPTGAELEFWKTNPPQKTLEIKANA